MTSLTNEMPDLVAHLKNEDFLHTEKFPEATFQSETIAAAGASSYTVKGELCLRGACHPETITVKVASSKEAHKVTFDASIDRTRYGILFASTKQPHKDYSIPDAVQLRGTLSFSRDYPGSNPYNSVSPKSGKRK